MTRTGTRSAVICGRRELKIGNVIMAAPDIDQSVAQPCFRSDRVDKMRDRMTIYVTPEDKALGLTGFVIGSLARVGSVKITDPTPKKSMASKSGRAGLDALEVKVTQKGAHDHTYWIDSPTVLSDVVLILRDDAPPGETHGRPLTRAASGMW